MGSYDMRVLTTGGLSLLEVEDADDRSLIGAHHNALRRAMEGDLDAIGDFRGQTIVGRVPGEHEPRRFELEADLWSLKRWYAQGELDYEDIYAD